LARQQLARRREIERCPVSTDTTQHTAALPGIRYNHPPNANTRVRQFNRLRTAASSTTARMRTLAVNVVVVAVGLVPLLLLVVVVVVGGGGSCGRTIAASTMKAVVRASAAPPSAGTRVPRMQHDLHGNRTWSRGLQRTTQETVVSTC
jgi:hypothetical protein